MCYARLIRLVSLAAATGGCGTDPLVCPDEAVLVTMAVANCTGQAFPSLSVLDTVLRTGRVLEITATHPSGDLPAGGVSLCPNFQQSLQGRDSRHR